MFLTLSAAAQIATRGQTAHQSRVNDLSPWRWLKWSSLSSVKDSGDEMSARAKLNHSPACLDKDNHRSENAVWWGAEMRCSHVPAAMQKLVRALGGSRFVPSCFFIKSGGEGGGQIWILWAVAVVEKETFARSWLNYKGFDRILSYRVLYKKKRERGASSRDKWKTDLDSVVNVWYVVLYLQKKRKIMDHDINEQRWIPFSPHRCW